MRMSNDRDQVLLRSAVSDSAANLFAFVPALGTREALAFCVGVPLPTILGVTIDTGTPFYLLTVLVAALVAVAGGAGLLASSPAVAGLAVGETEDR